MLVRGASRQLAADVRKLCSQAARRPAPAAIHTVTRHIRGSFVHRQSRRPEAIQTYATATGATKNRSAAKTAVKPRKAAPKKTKAKKKKKAAPKKKVAKKAKKVLTPEATRRAKILGWKKAALLTEEPSVQSSAYTTFAHERWHQGSSGNSSNVSARAKELGAEWRSLSAGEKQHFEQTAVEQKAIRLQRHQAWVNEHTVEQIHTANLARRRLNAMNKKLAAESNTKIFGVSRRLPQIKDGRQIKRPGTPWSLFYTQHVKNGEFQGLPIATRAKELGQRWKALNAAEKKIYDDQAATARETYQQATHRT